MSRRKSVFDDVMEMPWPVGVIAAAISFIIFQLFLSKSPEGQLGPAVGSAVSMIGWFLTGMFLLAAFFSFLRQVIQGNRFKATRSMAEVRVLSWRQFELFIGERFRNEGYSVIETPEGPDNGVDLILRKDGEKTYVQCKQWKTNQVGVEKIRLLLGSMAAGGAQNGIFVTSGSCTGAARGLARECGIRVIDGDELASHYADYEEPFVCLTPFLMEDAEPKCPRCDASMVKRVANQGAHSGSEFWGCPNFPSCRGTREVE